MKRNRDEGKIDEIGSYPDAKEVASRNVARNNSKHDELKENNANENRPTGGINASTIIQSLPSEIIANILSFYSDSVAELAVSSRVCKSWRRALSKIERVRIGNRLFIGEDESYLRSIEAEMRFTTSQLPNINDLSLYYWGDTQNVFYFWHEVAQFVGFYSSKLKHFQFFRELCSRKMVMDHVFDCLQNAAQLESLTFEHCIFGQGNMLQGKPRLKKLKLHGLEPYDSDDDDVDADDRKALSIQIGKMHTLRELHLTGVVYTLEETNANILLSGLKNLQYLHICVPSFETLLAINRCCPALEHLHIADYGCPEVDVDLSHLMRFLKSSTIRTLNICSWLYADGVDVCDSSHIVGLCRPDTSMTLQRLIVSVDSDDALCDSYEELADRVSEGRIKLEH